MPTPEIADADEFAQPRTATLAHTSHKQRSDAMQMHILRCLEQSGQAGATNRDLVKYLQTHFETGNEFLQSPTSGATSRMHAEGLIVRTTQRRDGFVVYVHPDHVPADAVVVQPKQKKEAQVFGSKAKTNAREGVEVELRTRLSRLSEALRAAEHVRDTEASSARLALSQRDQALDELRQAIVERDAASQAATEFFNEATALRTRVGELQTSLDQAEVQSPAPQSPRKTFTTDERRLLDGVAKLLRDRYPSNGTLDNPVRVTLKASTVRSIVNGALRVARD